MVEFFYVFILYTYKESVQLFNHTPTYIRLTLSFMAVEMVNTKVIRRLMLNHVLNCHFSEKQP